MAEIVNSENTANQSGRKKLLATLLLPLLFLAVAFVALAYRSRIVKPAAERIRLTDAQSQKLDQQSKAMFAAGRYSEALPPTVTLSKAYPDNHIYLRRLAETYDHLGQYEDEARSWEDYMNHAPLPIEACPNIGQAYWKQGISAQPHAIDAFRRCLALDTKNTDSIFYLAHALEMSGQWAQAAEQYQNGIALSPNYVDLSLGLARCDVRMSKTAEAKSIVQKILHDHPASAEAYLVLGMLYLEQKNFPEAKKALAHGAELSQKDPDFHLLLARVASETHDQAEELRQYNKLVDMNPGDVDWRNRRDALAVQGASK